MANGNRGNHVVINTDTGRQVSCHVGRNNASAAARIRQEASEDKNISNLIDTMNKDVSEIAKGIFTKPSNRFFIVRNRMARDLGDTRPENMVPIEAERRKKLYAFVEEQNEASRPVSLFTAPSKGDAIKKAKDKVTRKKIPMVTLGNAVGRLSGRFVFKDVMIITFTGEE